MVSPLPGKYDLGRPGRRPPSLAPHSQPTVGPAKTRPPAPPAPAPAAATCPACPRAPAFSPPSPACRTRARLGSRLPLPQGSARTHICIRAAAAPPLPLPSPGSPALTAPPPAPPPPGARAEGPPGPGRGLCGARSPGGRVPCCSQPGSEEAGPTELPPASAALPCPACPRAGAGPVPGIPERREQLVSRTRFCRGTRDAASRVSPPTRSRSRPERPPRPCRRAGAASAPDPGRPLGPCPARPGRLSAQAAARGEAGPGSRGAAAQRAPGPRAATRQQRRSKRRAPGRAHPGWRETLRGEPGSCGLARRLRWLRVGASEPSGAPRALGLPRPAPGSAVRLRASGRVWGDRPPSAAPPPAGRGSPEKSLV